MGVTRTQQMWSSGGGTPGMSPQPSNTRGVPSGGETPGMCPSTKQALSQIFSPYKIMKWLDNNVAVPGTAGVTGFNEREGKVGVVLLWIFTMHVCARGKGISFVCHLFYRLLSP